jgi:DNA-binding MarR family transcriptional regulator
MSPLPPFRRAEIEEAVVLAFFDLANHLSRRGEGLARRAGLTTHQWLTLLQIAGDPAFASGTRGAGDGVLASAIAEARGVSRASVSAIVAGLLARGLVRQVAVPEDRRRRRLEVTEAGRRALGAIEPARRRANRALLAELSPRERRQLLGHLRSCLRALAAEPPADRPRGALREANP